MATLGESLILTISGLIAKVPLTLAHVTPPASVAPEQNKNDSHGAVSARPTSRAAHIRSKERSYHLPLVSGSHGKSGHEHLSPEPAPYSCLSGHNWDQLR